MLVLFENLAPVCMLVIEVSIVSSRMRLQKSWVGVFLHRELLDGDRDRLTAVGRPHLILEWRRSGKSATCRAISVICD